MLGALVVLVGGFFFIRFRSERSSSEPAPEPLRQSANAAVPPPTYPAPAASSAPSVAPRVRTSPVKVGAPVYLRLDAIKPVRAGSTLRGRLRANINSAYYDYPGDSGDAGPSWIEVGAPTQGKSFLINRSFSYEVYFELEMRGGQKLSGQAETVDLTSPSGVISDKLPYSEDYKLYFTGHGMKAPEPAAILSYTITDTP